MHRTEAGFAVETKNDVAVRVGKSYIPHPEVRFSGGSIKWYEDRLKQDAQCVAGGR